MAALRNPANGVLKMDGADNTKSPRAIRDLPERALPFEPCPAVVSPAPWARMCGQVGRGPCRLGVRAGSQSPSAVAGGSRGQ